MKLKVGDVIEVRGGVIAIVHKIKPKNRELDDFIYLGSGLDLEDIDCFSIIPVIETKWAWYHPKELVNIIYTACIYEKPVEYDYEDDEM